MKLNSEAVKAKQLNNVSDKIYELKLMLLKLTDKKNALMANYSAMTLGQRRTNKNKAGF